MDTFSIFYTSSLVFLSVVVPGLALSLALFPKISEIKTVERLGLSILLGVVPALTLYFLDKNLSFQITTTTSILAYGGLTLVGLGVWKFRENASR